MLIVFSPFLIRGTTLVGFNDSYLQHYPFILKIKYFYENLLFHHKLSLVNTYDYMGLDIFNLYTYYGLGNPFSLLFIGWKTDFIPYVFSFSVLLKIYLGGIAFQYLGHELNTEKKTTFLCSLLYIINPFVFSALEQFNFYDMLYQFPLLIAGLHQIIKRKKSRLFVAVLTLTFSCGFYWLYVQTILLIIYALFHILTEQTDFKEKATLALKTIINTSVHYIIAFLLSAWIFIPSIFNLTNMYRLSSKNTYNLLMYPISTLTKMFVQSFFCNSSYWVTLCLYLIPLIIFMVRNIKKYKVNLAVIILLYIVSYIPAMGYIANGFSYPVNRWFGGAYLFIILLIIAPLKEMISKVEFSKKIFAGTIIFLGILQPLLYTFVYSQYCFKAKQLNSILNNTLTTKIEPNEKIDYNGNEYVNSLSFNTRCQMNIYNSSLPKQLINSHINVGLSTLQNANIISGLDFRSELEALYNVDKYLASAGSPVPYGFEEIYRDNNNNIIYKNSHRLHFGYTYDSFINESHSEIEESPAYSWNSLDSCFIEDQYIKDVLVAEKETDISVLSGVSFKTNETSEGEKQFSFDSLTNCEVYAKIKVNNTKIANIITTANNYSSKLKISSPNSSWIVNRKYYYLNIGYFDEISSFSLASNEDFTVEEILFHRMDNFEQQVAHLDEYHMENITFDSDTVTGTIDIPDTRILCLSIPFQKGWKATVDGKETDIFPINGCFMGINLSPGYHNIKLHYMNPYLIPGFIISLITLLIILICKIIKSIYKKSKK
jgi:uncharacterized membrane protein YfhO